MGLVLGVMARAPVAGRCKTRLVPALGAEGAASLYDAMLRDSLDAYTRVRATRHVVLGAPEENGCAALRALAPSGWEVIPQTGPGLGQRLAAAMTTLGASGDAVVIASSDSPMAPVEALEAARGVLRAPRHVLLGPCTDGGYYLIGVSETQPGVLDGITWSTSAVLTETRARCKSLGLALRELPVTFDVDEPADLGTLEAAVRADPGRAPRVAAALGIARSLAERRAARA
jgi:rSAM/selenodomain-associated transferase 1